MPVYEGTNGRFYTERDVCRQLDTNVWRLCMWDETTGKELVETESAELMMLTPVNENELPEWVELKPAGRGRTIVDRRIEQD
ncbi:hypothetical protein [Halegenticoccus tardaugens]|uniref:hypothetical protein n=1 Tax=Halegenticoccus tardaugens TaxID=2071624 RepID=UPI00100BF982|nr:hypothetical protein [Halegenticoccus tardaugens]